MTHVSTELRAFLETTETGRTMLEEAAKAQELETGVARTGLADEIAALEARLATDAPAFDQELAARERAMLDAHAEWTRLAQEHEAFRMNGGGRLHSLRAGIASRQAALAKGAHPSIAQFLRASEQGMSDMTAGGRWGTFELSRMSGRSQNRFYEAIRQAREEAAALAHRPNVQEQAHGIRAIEERLQTMYDRWVAKA